jgi:hypothetical protein
MNVFEREIIFGEFLETQNICILRSILDPGAFLNQWRPNLYYERNESSSE